MADALTKAGRYEVVRELGRGSMGVVYEGFDPVIGRRIAIKTMLTEGLSSQEFREYKARFQREAQAAGVLNHPNIVNVFDYGEDGGVLYLIMEYLEGKSLEKFVEQQGLLPIETIIPLYDHICNALDHAHQHGIVHRDIKPANIMILDNGLVKVTDFGIAKMLSMGMTQAGQILGTPNYMSPEQVKGRQVDGRSDIFSLGIILYDLVTGEMPFAGQNITTVIYKIINENPIPPRELDATIHPGLDYVIRKALAKNADERYQTCRELADDLKNFKYLGGQTAPSTTVMLKAPPLQTADLEHGEGPAVESPAPPVAPPAPAQMAPVQEPAPEAVPAEAIGPEPAYQKPPASPMVWIFATLLGVVILGLLGGIGYWYLKKGKPEVASAPPVGQLLVESNLPGAQIWVDGSHRPECVTPCTISDLSPGSHQVEVSKAGYNNFTQTITIEGGKTNRVTASLSALSAKVVPSPLSPAAKSEHKAAVASKPTETNPVKETPAIPLPAVNPEKPSVTPKTGQLLITANVSGAKISIDGNSDAAWVTPYSTPIVLAAGTHQVVVSKDGYDNNQRSVTIESGKTFTVNAELSMATGEVVVMTTPPGFDVSIDGKPIGPSPAHAIVVAGPHKYTINGPGTMPYEGTFTAKSGMLMNVKVSLTGGSATGIVSVKTIPPGATVYVDGNPVGGQTPTSFKLAAGKHTLGFSLSGYKPVQRIIEVTADGNVPEVDVELPRQ